MFGYPPSFGYQTPLVVTHYTPLLLGHWLSLCGPQPTAFHEAGCSPYPTKTRKDTPVTKTELILSIFCFITLC